MLIKLSKDEKLILEKNAIILYVSGEMYSRGKKKKLTRLQVVPKSNQK